MSHQPRPRVITLIFVMLGFGAAGCADAPSSRVGIDAGAASEQVLLPPPAGSAEPDPVLFSVREAYRFETIEQMVATSDAVVVGVAEADARGRVFGEAPGQLQSRDVTVNVDSVLAGRYAVGDRVVVQEMGWGAQGEPLALEGLQPMRIGQRYLLFLTGVDETQKDLAETHAGPRAVVTNSQGRYEVSTDGSLARTVVPDLMAEDASVAHQDASDALTSELASLDLDSLTTRVADAAAAVERGEVAPLETLPRAPVESPPSSN